MIAEERPAMIGYLKADEQYPNEKYQGIPEFDITDFAITHPGWKVRRSLWCVSAGRAGRARR